MVAIWGTSPTTSRRSERLRQERISRPVAARSIPRIPTKTLAGAKITLSGEYARMQDTFRNLSLGLVLASRC